MSEVTRDDPSRQSAAAALAPSTKKPQPAEDDVRIRKNTRTLDYLWKSGTAGGLAGCAVC